MWCLKGLSGYFFFLNKSILGNVGHLSFYFTNKTGNQEKNKPQHLMKKEICECTTRYKLMYQQCRIPNGWIFFPPPPLFFFGFVFLFRVVSAAAGLRSIKVMPLIFATELPALVRST